jgi:hypothetical protein
MADARALVRSAARLLQLPPTATATSLAFVHGWQEAVHGVTEGEAGGGGGGGGDCGAAPQPALPALPAPRLAAAALFLAAKASPDTSGSVRTNDLVNAVAFCQWEAAGGGDGDGGSDGGRGSAHPPPFQAAAGSRYAAAKATLLADEALLLRVLRFRVAPGADAALKVALNAVRVLGRSARVAAGAAALCSDALAHTRLRSRAGPGTIAAAAVLVASLAAGEEEEEEGGARRADGSSVRWWEALGADTDGVLAAAGEMVGMAETGLI